MVKIGIIWVHNGEGQDENVGVSSHTHITRGQFFSIPHKTTFNSFIFPILHSQYIVSSTFSMILHIVYQSHFSSISATFLSINFFSSSTSTIYGLTAIPVSLLIMPIC